MILLSARVGVNRLAMVNHHRNIVANTGMVLSGRHWENAMTMTSYRQPPGEMSMVASYLRQMQRALDLLVQGSLRPYHSLNRI
jgi:hypothetical protein